MQYDSVDDNSNNSVQEKNMCRAKDERKCGKNI